MKAYNRRDSRVHKYGRSDVIHPAWNDWHSDGIYKLTTPLEEDTCLNVRHESPQNNHAADAKTSQTHNRHPRKCCTKTATVTCYTTGHLVIIKRVYTGIIPYFKHANSIQRFATGLRHSWNPHTLSTSLLFKHRCHVIAEKGAKNVKPFSGNAKYLKYQITVTLGWWGFQYFKVIKRWKNVGQNSVR